MDWLYYRFNLGHKGIEDLLAERGISVTQASIRLWCIKFGQKYARRLKRNHNGDGDVVDVFLQSRRDGPAAKRFFKRLLRGKGGEPRKIVTDKLRSNNGAHRELVPETIHDTSQYANNLAELSHQPTRDRERGMRKFLSVKQGQRFLDVHATEYSLFNFGRHLIAADHYRNPQTSAFAEWSRAAT